MVTFVVLRIVAVVLLVAANAFFVAAEFALVSVRETRLQQMIAAHRIGARTVQKLHQKLDEVLNAVQFGVTVCSLALGWIGEASIAHMLEPFFLPLPYSRFYAHAIAVVLAFVLMTYLVVILGEVVPKSLTLQRTDRVALGRCRADGRLHDAGGAVPGLHDGLDAGGAQGVWRTAGARERACIRRKN